MERRNSTNAFLKECIADATLALMKTKKLEDISIQEITDLAGVGRSTYYRNFDSKIDILRYKERTLRAQWMKQANYDSEDGYWKVVSDLCKYLSENKTQLSFLYDSDQLQLLCQMLYEVMGPQETDDRETALQKAHLSFGTFGILYQWVKDGMQESPEQISQIIQADCSRHGFC